MPIVTNPTAGDIHVNRPLTNFSQKFLLKAEMFIALRAMPNLPVAKQSDLYYVFNREDFYRDEAQERADGTESAGGGFTLSTEPYFARVFAFHKDVTDRQRSNQDEVIRLDESATQYVTHKMLIRREKDFLDSFFAAGIWATEPDLTGANNWGSATSTPIQDIRDGIRAVHAATGYRPNRMMISRTGYDALLDNDEILSRINGGSTSSQPAQVQKTLLAQLFELDEIFVVDAVENTANRGATENTQFIGGDNALLYYAPASVGVDEPTAGTSFSWTGFMGATNSGLRIKRFREERIEADRIEGQMSFDHKVVAPELGYLFRNVTASA